MISVLVKFTDVAIVDITLLQGLNLFFLQPPFQAPEITTHLDVIVHLVPGVDYLIKTVISKLDGIFILFRSS